MGSSSGETDFSPSMYMHNHNGLSTCLSMHMLNLTYHCSGEISVSPHLQYMDNSKSGSAKGVFKHSPNKLFMHNSSGVKGDLNIYVVSFSMHNSSYVHLSAFTQHII